MKNFGTTEQKGEVLLMGASLVSGLVTSFVENRKTTETAIKEAGNDGKYTAEEYEALKKEYNEMYKLVNNILTDSELGCNFKKTETYYLEIIRIFLFDKEADHREIIDNFTSFIDNELFISSHEIAVQKREERLDKEHQLDLKEYHVQMQQYNQKLNEHKSKNFFSKIFADEPIAPEKPARRS